jgi:hypothetical protein
MTEASSTIIPPDEGRTTVADKMFYETELLSYRCAESIASSIACKVRASLRGRTVVIVGTPLLADFANLDALLLTLADMQNEYEAITARAESVVQAKLRREVAKSQAGETSRRFEEALIPEANIPSALLGGLTGASIVGAATSAVGVAAPLVGAALGLVGLLKQDNQYYGDRTTLDPLAFELALADQLKQGGADAVIVPNLTVFQPAKNPDSIISLMERLQASKSASWSSVGPMIAELVSLEKELADASAAKNQAEIDRLSKELAETRRNLDPLAIPLERADQRLADLQAKWEKVDESTGWSLLARMLRAEAIHRDRPIYLHAAIVSSGGHHRINRSLWRLITLSDGLSFTGGAVVRWALLDPHGMIQNGGILSERRTSELPCRARDRGKHRPPQPANGIDWGRNVDAG